MTVVRSLIFLLGAALIAGTLLSMVRTVIVPRGEVTLLTWVVFRPLGQLARAFVTRSSSADRRDRIMTLYAPIGLILLPFVWAVVLSLGFMGLFFGMGRGPGEAFLVSGSSLLTLGFAPVEGLAEQVVAFTEATIGLGVVALLITFLPSIYASYSRRETVVGLLDVRAGNPPRAEEFINRHHQIGRLEHLPESWAEWERWFVQIAESHLSYPMLVFFRSPQPGHSWITAAGTILDAASLTNAVVDVAHQPEADLCIRSGYVALRRICDYFGIRYDPDPAPHDPTSIARSEFDAVVDRLAADGVPIKPDRDQAWRDYSGWRVNYDTPLLALAELVVAPYAPWSSDRSPVNGGRRRVTLGRWVRTRVS